jgi:hypothetical protein
VVDIGDLSEDSTVIEMGLQELSLRIILLCSAGLSLIVAWMGWKRRKINGVLPFALMNLAATLWCLGAAFEAPLPGHPAVPGYR